MSSLKIVRGKNFTEREKAILLSIIDKHKNILEDKTTNAANIVKKKQTWEIVASEFNSCSEIPRSTKQLQTAYLNLKRLTRKDVADKNMQNYIQRTAVSERKFKNQEEPITEEKAIKATGGGSYKPQLSDVGAQMLAIMGNQIEPLHNSCDSASNYYGHYVELEEQGANIEIITEDNTEHENHSDATIRKVNEQGHGKDKEGRRQHIVTTKPRGGQLKKNGLQKINKSEDLRKKYYAKKIECATVEKRSRLLEYKLNMKKLQLLDLEIKLKQRDLKNNV